MKQKQGLDLAAVILLLLIACAALAVPVALLSPKWLIAPAVLVVAALGVLWYQRRRLRTFVAKNLCSTDFENSRIQYSLTGLPIPTMLIADGRVLWYNTIFREKVLNGTDAVTRPIDRLFPGTGPCGLQPPPRSGLDRREQAVHRLRRRRQGQPRGQHRLPCGRYRL